MSQIVQVGSNVLVRVDRLFQTLDKAEVVVVSIEGEGGVPLPFETNPFRGSIRLQDVRAFDIDKASISDHFAAGDIVRAKTIAVGDAKSTFFSTIGSEYGVVLAKEQPIGDGEFLVPVDQSHMRNASNTAVYKRKVAKPVWMTAAVENN